MIETLEEIAGLLIVDYVAAGFVGGAFLFIWSMFLSDVWIYFKFTFLEKKLRKIDFINLAIRLGKALLVIFAIVLLIIYFFNNIEVKECIIIFLFAIIQSMYVEKRDNSLKESLNKSKVKYYVEYWDRLKSYPELSLIETLNIDYSKLNRVGFSCSNNDYYLMINDDKETIYSNRVTSDKFFNKTRLIFDGEKQYELTILLAKFMDFINKVPYNFFPMYLFETNIAYNIYVIDNENFSYNLLKTLKFLVEYEYLSFEKANDLLCEIYFDNYKYFDFENTVVLFEHFSYNYWQLFEYKEMYENDQENFISLFYDNLKNNTYIKHDYDSLSFDDLHDFNYFENRMKVINNTYATAKKKYKNDMKKVWKKLIVDLKKHEQYIKFIDYISNSTLIDVGIDTIILLVEDSEARNKILKMEKYILKFLEDEFSKKYSILILLPEEWNFEQQIYNKYIEEEKEYIYIKD